MSLRIPDFHIKAPREWNTITRVISNPCNDPWIVYVETLLPALGQMALVLVTFGMLDVVRGFLRPTGISPKGGRKRDREGGRGGKRGPGGIPEIGNMIGSKLAGVARYEPVVSDGLRHLWIIDGVIQRGLWYWLLADTFADGAYTWASGLLKEQFCSTGWQQVCHAKNSNVAYLGLLPGWQDPGALQKVSGQCAVFQGAQWQAGAKGGFIAWTVEARPQMVLDVTPFEARITTPAGDTIYYDAKRSFLGGKETFAGSASLRPFETGICQVKNNGRTWLEGKNDFIGISF